MKSMICTRQLEAEILQAQSRVKQFESTYRTTFQGFEANVLPILNSWEAHNDYNDWFFWQSLLDKKSKFLQEVYLEDLVPSTITS